MDSLDKAGTLRKNSEKICFVVMKTGNTSHKFQNGKSFRYKLFSEASVPQRFPNCWRTSKLGSTISCAIGILLTVLGTLANLKPHFSFFFFFSLFPRPPQNPQKRNRTLSLWRRWWSGGCASGRWSVSLPSLSWQSVSHNSLPCTNHTTTPSRTCS